VLSSEAGSGWTTTFAPWSGRSPIEPPRTSSTARRREGPGDGVLLPFGVLPEGSSRSSTKWTNSAIWLCRRAPPGAAARWSGWSVQHPNQRPLSSLFCLGARLCRWRRNHRLPL